MSGLKYMERAKEFVKGKEQMFAAGTFRRPATMNLLLQTIAIEMEGVALEARLDSCKEFSKVLDKAREQ